MDTRNEILSFDSLLIGYSSGKNDNEILPPLSARAFEGELIAIVGENGIGKSTLLRTLTGLQKSLGGKIYLNGKSINGYTKNELAKNIGYISTEPVKVSNMTVYDLVSLGRYPYTDWFGKLTSEDEAIVMDSIEKVGMKNFDSRYITELSDGERQRVMIARVLAQDTSLLLMDEPTAFLDIKSRYEILHLMHELSRKRGKTIIYSTHDLNIALRESDKIWIILDDKLCEGAPEDLILDGAFDLLFMDSLVKFNKNDGSFTFRNEITGNIKVTGEGTARLWTEKALNRAGFSISEVESEMVLEVKESQGGYRWTLLGNHGIKEFTRIYDLVSWLSKVN